MLTQWSLVFLSRVSTTASRFIKNKNDETIFLMCANSRFFRDKTRLPRTSAESQHYSFKSINFHLINVWLSVWDTSIKVDRNARNVKEFMPKFSYKKKIKVCERNSSSSHCVRLAYSRESEWVEKDSELEPVVSGVSYI